MEESLQPLSRGELPRGEVMQTPDEVAAMLRLKSLGWGRPTDREGIGLQPHDSAAIPVGRGLGAAPRPWPASRASRA